MISKDVGLLPDSVQEAKNITGNKRNTEIVGILRKKDVADRIGLLVFKWLLDQYRFNHGIENWRIQFYKIDSTG